MFSNDELERLITLKRSEITKEKIVLGLLLSPPEEVSPDLKEIKNGKSSPLAKKKTVKTTDQKSEHNVTASCEKEKDKHISPLSYKLEDHLPAGLDRYIRRYLGLPDMLKAGEFSPNNPLIRGERSTGDVLLGLGEYERRRNTLRKIQQQQYREILDQQAKLKQEAKERAERERKEREEKERQWEERERERLREEEERARAREKDKENHRQATCYVPSCGGKVNDRGKVDTGVQVGISKPLSVAIQTDDSALYSQLSRQNNDKQLTEAERELSPRTVNLHDERTVRPAPWDVADWDTKWDKVATEKATPKQLSRDRLTSDLRHTYLPSIFDAEAIHLRNQQAEKEAALRRQLYQQELRHQIHEQQRIREQRRITEKMLEEAEMRRLEEQLRVLRGERDDVLQTSRNNEKKARENAEDFTIKKSILQNEINMENKKLRSGHHTITRTSVTNDSSQKSPMSNLPFYYPKIQERSNEICSKKPPFSTNIPENSIFSPSYDVDSYLRKNLNPSKEFLLASRLDSYADKLDIENIGNGDRSNVVVERALVHDQPKDKSIKRSKDYENKGNYDVPLHAYDGSNLRHVNDEKSDILSATKYKSCKLSDLNINSESLTKYEASKNKNLIGKSESAIEVCPLNKHESSRFNNYNEIKENTGQECVLDKYQFARNFVEEKDDDILQDYQLSNFETLRSVNNNNTKEKVMQNRPKETENLNEVTSKALIHESPKEKSKNSNNYKDIDDIPIPVLKHNTSPIIKDPTEVVNKLSKDMKLVEGKWKVPAVQKNILKSLPSENGKNVSILTQLGSIRRQLQLEQLRLDNMLPKDQ